MPIPKQLQNTTRFRTFIPNISTHPPEMKSWVRLNRLCTRVGRFRTCSHIWGMALSAACEIGAEEQTIDYVDPECPIHRHHYGLHGLTVLDDLLLLSQLFHPLLGWARFRGRC